MKTYSILLNTDVTYEQTMKHLAQLNIGHYTNQEINIHQENDDWYISFKIMNGSMRNNLITYCYQYNPEEHAIDIPAHVPFGNPYDFVHRMIVEYIAEHYGIQSYAYGDETIHLASHGIYTKLPDNASFHDYVESHNAHEGIIAFLEHIQLKLAEKTIPWSNNHLPF